MVFNEQSDLGASAPPGVEEDPRTVIDQRGLGDAAQELRALQAELRRELEKQDRPPTPPPRNDTLAEPAGAEFEDTLTSGSLDFAPTELDHNDTIPAGAGALAYDPLIEQSLPPGAKISREQDPEANPQIPAAQQAAPPVVESDPRPDSSAALQTHLDLAAALGVAPEPTGKEERKRSLPEGMTRPPEPSLEKLDVGQFLGKKASKRDFAAKSSSQPDPHNLDQIQDLARATDNIAKILPTLLGGFVLLATVVLGVLLMSGRSVSTEHVELYFLSQGPGNGVEYGKQYSTPIVIESDPPGLMIVHQQELLGKTPLSTTLPVRLPSKISVQLSSPFYDTWFGEVQEELTGEYRIKATLRRQ